MLRVILVEPEGEYNVGFVARLCKNFEVDQLYVVNPRCDLNKAMEFSAKGRDFMERVTVTSTLQEALRDLDLKISTSSIADSKGDMLRKSMPPWEIVKLMENRRTGLVFGRESVGLTREEIMMTDIMVHIPANRDYPVLNLSHAVGIILYEIWKSTHLRPGEAGPAPSQETITLVEKYVKTLYDTVKRSDGDDAMYIATKRSLLRGIRDEEEGRAVVRFLRKVYMRMIHGNE
ncbi:tRNA (cytidine-2'-O-)-methyltransferase TrmJ [Metallosphaera sp. J1]|uniref:tRNA (cytidine-2'-O-)-methyltransferase TrmJ n=1 Tax=Metallosphaera javensis (ex Hofmann et al. 2022) TaxID=99938 RepID=UPI001EDFCA41|nr:tRNA (cytidine-2'-O-)-methyltransferase TrmJ [Metallosphaera javensis (ex Hofmann et al. 2022)]MCG3107801.1 tRNA (cytidine-2'-O-)-methyltransferase TrmJ [Metallosphaera javensis (ex Hofmann et al. 2022)]